MEQFVRLEETEESCSQPECTGKLVEALVMPHYDVLRTPTGSSIPQESRGYHCKKCGVRYAFLPSKR